MHMADVANEDSSSGGVFGDMHPYRGRTRSYAALPKKGRDREDILRELGGLAQREDAR
jgi:hypothetical protein